MENRQGDSKVLSENSMVRKINETFSQESNTSMDLLQSFLSECSDVLFVENCTKWMRMCCALKDEKVESVLRNIDILRRITKMSSKFPELVKPITSTVVPRYVELFFKKLTHLNSSWILMEELLWSYNGPFASYRDQLTELMKTLLKDPNKFRIRQAQFFALLPSGGGGGQDGVVHIQNWRRQHDYVVTALHRTLNRLFKDIQELQVYGSEEDIDPDDGDIDATSVDRLTTSFCNHCLLLQAMYTTRYPVAKNFKPREAILLVRRCLSVTEISTSPSSVLRRVLPSLHRAALAALAGLVVCGGTSLLSLSTDIVQLVRSGVQSHSGKVRTAAHSCLIYWLTASGSGGCAETIAKVVVPSLLSDVVQEAQGIQLRDKNAAMEQNRSRLAACDFNENLCHSALATLNSYVKSVGPLLPAEIQKEIQTVVIRKLIYYYKSNASAQQLSPRCLESLYSLLLQLCISPNPTWPPPSQYAICLLHAGQKNRNPQIVAMCTLGLATLSTKLGPESYGASPVTGSNDEETVKLQWRQNSNNSENTASVENVVNAASVEEEIVEAVEEEMTVDVVEVEEEEASPEEEIDVDGEKMDVDETIDEDLPQSAEGETVDITETNSGEVAAINDSADAEPQNDSIQHESPLPSPEKESQSPLRVCDEQKETPESATEKVSHQEECTDPMQLEPQIVTGDTSDEEIISGPSNITVEDLEQPKGQLESSDENKGSTTQCSQETVVRVDDVTDIQVLSAESDKDESIISLDESSNTPIQERKPLLLLRRLPPVPFGENVERKQPEDNAENTPDSQQSVLRDVEVNPLSVDVESLTSSQEKEVYTQAQAFVYEDSSSNQSFAGSVVSVDSQVERLGTPKRGRSAAKKAETPGKTYNLRSLKNDHMALRSGSVLPVSAPSPPAKPRKTNSTEAADEEDLVSSFNDTLN